MVTPHLVLPIDLVDETRQWFMLIGCYQAHSTKLRLQVSFAHEMVLLTQCIQEPTWPNWWAWWHEHERMFDLYHEALYQWEIKQGYGTHEERATDFALEVKRQKGDLRFLTAEQIEEIDGLLDCGWQILYESPDTQRLVLMRGNLNPRLEERCQ